MDQVSGDISSRNNRQIFYFAAILLMLGAAVAAFWQKYNESAAAVAIATGNDVQIFAYNAQYWLVVSLAAVMLAVLCCGIAIWRQEKHQRMWGVVLTILFLYVLVGTLIIV